MFDMRAAWLAKDWIEDLRSPAWEDDASCPSPVLTAAKPDDMELLSAEIDAEFASPPTSVFRAFNSPERSEKFPLMSAESPPIEVCTPVNPVEMAEDMSP